jgi:hypothetical protein
VSEQTSAAPRKTGGRKAGSKSLTEKQKAEACALWKSGDITLEGLAKRFGRTTRGISFMLATAGAEKGSERAAVHKAVTDKVNKELAGNATVIAAQIRETKDSHYNAAKVIAGLIQRQLVNCQTNGTPFLTVQNEIKTLKLAAEALATLRAERFAILGIANGEPDDSEELPELGIHEMTAEQIALMQSQQEGGDLDEMGDSDPGAHNLPMIPAPMGDGLDEAA